MKLIPFFIGNADAPQNRGYNLTFTGEKFEDQYGYPQINPSVYTWYDDEFNLNGNASRMLAPDEPVDFWNGDATPEMGYVRFPWMDQNPQPWEVTFDQELFRGGVIDIQCVFRPTYIPPEDQASAIIKDVDLFYVSMGGATLYRATATRMWHQGAPWFAVAFEFLDADGTTRSWGGGGYVKMIEDTDPDVIRPLFARIRTVTSGGIMRMFLTYGGVSDTAPAGTFLTIPGIHTPTVDAGILMMQGVDGANDPFFHQTLDIYRFSIEGYQP